MNVLIIDNTIDRESWGSNELVRSLNHHSSVTVWVRRSPHQDLPLLKTLKRYDRIILSGSKTSATASSEWIHQLDQAIRVILNEGIPLLGVCYGHQAIGRVLGSDEFSLNVRRSATPEIGWTPIFRTPPTLGRDILSGLPERFHSFSVHYDEVCSIPRGCTLLAKSERCAIQAFALEDRPAFGIQFHPERDCDAGEKTLRNQSKERLSFPLLNTGQGARLYSANVAQVIFKNFLKGI